MAGVGPVQLVHDVLKVKSSELGGPELFRVRAALLKEGISDHADGRSHQGPVHSLLCRLPTGVSGMALLAAGDPSSSLPGGFRQPCRVHSSQVLSAA